MAQASASGPDWVAIYAAIVATVALGWQIFTWFRRERTTVEVTGQYMEVVSVYGGAAGVAFQAVNRSGHPVEIRNAWTQGVGTSGEHIEVPSYNSQTPQTVQPRAAYEWDMSLTDLADHGLDLQRGIEGWIRLATGETPHSPRIDPPPGQMIPAPSAVMRPS